MTYRKENMKRYKYSRVVAEMRAKGESQQTLSAILGIRDNTLRNKFDGKAEWTISEIYTLCEHYNKNFYELFKTED